MGAMVVLKVIVVGVVVVGLLVVICALSVSKSVDEATDRARATKARREQSDDVVRYR